MNAALSKEEASEIESSCQMCYCRRSIWRGNTNGTHVATKGDERKILSRIKTELINTTNSVAVAETNKQKQEHQLHHQQQQWKIDSLFLQCRDAHTRCHHSHTIQNRMNKLIHAVFNDCLYTTYTFFYLNKFTSERIGFCTDQNATHCLAACVWICVWESHIANFSIKRQLKRKKKCMEKKWKQMTTYGGGNDNNDGRPHRQVTWNQNAIPLLMRHTSRT